MGLQFAAVVRGRIAIAVGRSPESLRFLPLQESDELMAALLIRLTEARDGKSNYQVCALEAESAHEVEQQIATLEHLFGQAEMFLFTPESSYCGAVCVHAPELLASALRLATLDQDELLACDRTGDRGLSLDYSTDVWPARTERKYRLTAWATALSHTDVAR